MLRFRLDRAFAHYAQTGDARSLARVFDGTAAELYRLGYHLLGDRHAAEDLVQQTFVVAIERAQTYERGRGVLSWLCGILTNRALQMRRQARQRAGKITGVADVVADPVAEASAHELSATVVATVRSLPEPYRQVLLLHLVHELAPKEIADALARPDATVRTQLARGLDLLRKVLPAGIAGLAAGCVPAPIGLATVRAAVLARAGDGAVMASFGAATFAGGLAMKKVMLAVVIALLVLGTWPWWGSDPMRPVAVEAGADRAAVAAGEMVQPRTAPADGGETLRVEAAVPADANARAGLEVAVLWSDGTPAREVTVRCRPYPLDVELWLQANRTGADGVARFAALPGGKVQAIADRGGAIDVELAAGITQRITLTLPRGIDVRGRVLDTDERPIAGATVWLSVTPYSDDGEPVATSGPDGAFAIRSATAGHTITATARGYGCMRVASVGEQHASQELVSQELVIVLRVAPGVLVGSVVDPGGRPVADARVLLGVTLIDPARGVHLRLTGEIVGLDVWPSRFLHTDAAGQFRAEGLPPLRWPVWVGALGFGPSRVVVDVRAEAETHVTIVLQPGVAVVRGTVQDVAGLPVAAAYVHAMPQVPPVHVSIGPGRPGNFFPPLWMQMHTRSDAQGQYEIRGLLPGRNGFRALLRDDRVDVVRDVADGETVVWNPVLEPPLSLHGSVVDGDGTPLAGWRVSFSDGTSTTSVRTDAQGRFRADSMRDIEYGITAQPSHPDCATQFRAGRFRPPDSPIRIVVPRDQVPRAGMRGRILSPDGSPCAETKVLGRGRGLFTSALSDADGRYQFGAMQRGTYRLEVDSSKFGRCPVGEFEAVDGQVTDLGEFRVPTPGQLVVTIVDAAGRRSPVWVAAHPQPDDHRGGTLTQRDGIARGTLPPGGYVVATCGEATLAAIAVEMRSGQTTEVRLVVPDGVPFLLRVPNAVREHVGLCESWRDAKGTLLRHAIVEWANSGKDVPWSAPPGRYSLEVRDGDGRTARTTFDLRASDPPQVVELPLPGR